MTTHQSADKDFPEELTEESPEESLEDIESAEEPGEVSEETMEQDLADLNAAADEVDPADIDEEGEEAPEENVPPTYEELESEVAALKDQLLRSLAESENTRRRMERDKADMSKYAITNFARQIVTVADNLSRALSSVSEEARQANEELNNLYIGIEMTDKELLNSFEQFNIKVIESVGQKFDHNLHQAMFEIDDAEQPAGMVMQEMQKGYVLHDRLLRPAMVGVTKGGPKLEAEDQPKTPVEPPKEKAANESSSAYEKQSEAADNVAEGDNSKLDTEL